MKRLTKLFMVWIAVATILFSTAQNYAINYDMANWYKINGIYSVMGQIMNGNMTLDEAMENIVKPASEAGYVTKQDALTMVEYYPDSAIYFGIYGVLTNEDLGVTGGETTTPTVTPEPAPAYTIEDCDIYKYATTDVNVRNDADTNAGRVGSVEQNGYAHITGKTSNGWYRLEYNGITGFSVQKYFSDKPIEIIEDVTDVPEPTAEPTPAPTEVPTPEPTAEPKTEVKEEATPAPTPTATPESDTKTTIVQPVDEATPAPTVTPKEEVTATPEPDKVVAEPTEAPKTEVKEEATPTEAPVTDVTTGTEPTSVPATQGVPQTEETNVVPYIIGGGILLIAGIVAGVIIFKKK